MKQLAKKVRLVKCGDLYVAKYKGKPVGDKHVWNDKTLVGNLTWNETVELARALRVRLPTIQETHDACHGEFKGLLAKYWVWNAEQIQKSDVQPNEKVAEYLQRKGLFKPTLPIWTWTPWFENGIVSVRSSWHPFEGRLSADASRPSNGDEHGLAVFAKGKVEHKHAFKCSCGVIKK